MGGPKRPRAKNCAKCGKGIRHQNKSGLCRHHYQMMWKKERNHQRFKKHICIECMEKVEPMIIYPAGDKLPPITKYLMRCYECQQKQKKRYKKYNDKRKEESVTTK